MEQPALRMNILNGLQKLHYNSLTYIPATEKRLDFVQRGVNKEMPSYACKTPRKRKPPDKVSFTIRGLGGVNYSVPIWPKLKMDEDGICKLTLY